MKNITRFIFKAFLMLVYMVGQLTVLIFDLVGGFIIGVLGSVVLFFMLVRYFYKHPEGSVKDFMETHDSW